VVAKAQSDTGQTLSAFLRPLDGNATLLGHFHTAIFPYRPLKKQLLELGDVVMELFDSAAIRDVMHLLRDDRPIMGAGESEFLEGACWMAPISNTLDWKNQK